MASRWMRANALGFRRLNVAFGGDDCGDGGGGDVAGVGYGGDVAVEEQS